MTKKTPRPGKRTSLPPLFALGQIVATPGALEASPPDYLYRCLFRHSRGDWGNVCAEDAASNHEAVTEGLRILSAYPIDPAKPCKGFGENTLWIITEGDRSVTTFLLPEEY
jgi:hypothetical protein